jgi:toxin ParE1/3/4
VAHKVVFRPRARDHLLSLYRYIATQAGPETALAYLQRIEDACMSLAHSPERGTQRPELGKNVRVIGFERRVAIAFRVTRSTVEILAISYAGRRFEDDVR